MRKRLLMMMVALLTTTLSFSQGFNKISGPTRFILAGQKGKISTDTPKNLRGKKVRQISAFDPNAVEDNTTFDNVMPFVQPTNIDGVEMVQCWINMSDKNYKSLERLGVKIQGKFNDRVTANVPVDKIEQLAALKNVQKVEVARKLKSNTYRTRQLTNVDDVLNNTADAQTAGLLQAYNGANVVLGVIDTGIDFGHTMFSGGRIKKKYVYDENANAIVEYTGSSAYFTNETHGTHTSTIAGGNTVNYTAYVYTTSTSYSTVSNAAFGGMAPGTDLVLCDLGEELSDANIAQSIQLISEYAESVNKPYVISLSLGGHAGPHDGTGNMADVCAQYTGPGKIIVFASGNEGDEGVYHGKNASRTSPSMTVLTSETRSSYNIDYGAILSYARTPNVELAATYYVVNTSTNQILWTSKEIDTDWGFVDENDNIIMYGAEFSVNDVGADGTTPLSNYFTAYNNDTDSYGFLCCYMDKDQNNNKWNVETLLYYLTPVRSNYKIGVSIYPKETGTSTYIDSWPEAYLSFTASSASVNGNTFTAGTSECSASDESSFPSVISVGAYTSSVYWRAGTTTASNQAWTNTHTYLDVASFSSYQQEGSGPLGIKLPWITAPGEVIISGYNSGYTAESNVYYAYGTNKVLGAMSGTSMACPCVAGITALWLQVKPDLTPDEAKFVMKATAISDQYTTGTNSYRFGQGKIDALAGIAFLLANDGPMMIATPSSLEFSSKPNETTTKTLNISATGLEGNITATLNDPTGMFSIDTNSIIKADAELANGKNINVTFTSDASEGTYNATITFTSTNADPVTVNLTATVRNGGTASDHYLDIAKYATIDDAGWRTALVNNLYKYTEYPTQKVAWLTMPVYGGFVGARYATNSSTVGSGHPQTWIESTLGTSNTYGGTTWTNTPSATSPFNGSGTYFTTATARAIGYNSRTNATIRDVYFYVTNTDQIMMNGTGRSGASATYPVRLRLYECTENADGTLTAGTTAVVNQTNSGTSTFTLTASNLDVNKIYKVEASIYRGYLYEIAFRTPMKTDPEITASQTALTFTANVNKTQSKSLTVTGQNLTDDITVSLNGANNVFSIDRNSITQSGGNASGTINVTFAPTITGNYTGTITLSSPNAQNVIINLSATATEPELIVDPSNLEITTPAAVSKTGTFSLLGENIDGNVTLTLNDVNNVFSLNKTTVTKSEVENGEDIIVTFNSADEGTFNATVTVSADGLANQTVNLTGIASKGWFDLAVGKYGIASLYTDIPLVIPFDDYEDLLGVFYGRSFSKEDKELRLKSLYTYIPANTAVIVQGNAGTYRFPIATTTVDGITDNVLKGVLEATPVSSIAGNVLTLGMGSNGYVGFYKYTGTTLRANSVYLELTDDEVKALNALSIVTGDDTTGINYIFGRAETETDDSWYTLQGLKLNGKPTTKGIYLHGGKTVLVK